MSLRTNLKIASFLFGYKKTCMFGCSIYGQKKFTQLCSEAFSLIEDIDPSLLDGSQLQNWIFFESIQRGALNAEKRAFAISSGWMKWHKEGICACIVHAYFSAECVDDNNSEPATVRGARKTRDWLASHSFNAALVDYFAR